MLNKIDHINEYWVLAGSYSNSSEEGIQLLRLDATAGQLEVATGISGIKNPSFISVDSNRGRFFAVSEVENEGAVVSYTYDLETRSLKEISRQTTRGGYPCHLSVDESGHFLFCVNYMSGSLCVYPIDAEGVIGSMSDFIQHKGRSIREDRQSSPHPHSIVNISGSPYWIVPDLGTDTLYIYEFDSINGKLKLHNETSAHPGAGPRHTAFHPLLTHIYIANELDCTVSHYSYDLKKGQLTHLQTTVCLPPESIKGYTAADIQITPDGGSLFVSIRGHDSLFHFQIHADGSLVSKGFIASGGKTPRNFAISPDGTFVLAANQDTNNIVMMKVKDGLPVTTGKEYHMNQPVCLKFL